MVNLTLLGKLEKIPLPKKFASLTGKRYLSQAQQVLLVARCLSV